MYPCPNHPIEISTFSVLVLMHVDTPVSCLMHVHQIKMTKLNVRTKEKIQLKNCFKSTLFSLI